MANIEITDQGGGTLSDGILQIANGLPLDATLRNVADQNNTNSPLKLSTTLVQTTSTLQITTNDNPYIDAEDGAGNNRFTIGRAPLSQQVNVDFASNPTGSTTIVGAIRTYQDGVNLSEVVKFREDGQVTFSERVNVEADSLVTTQTSSVIAADTTNASLVIAPNGTGALIANIPDGTATGGNARGNYAVDLQMSRSAANMVATANYSVIAGGLNNRIGGDDPAPVIGGGINNTITYGIGNTIAGGTANTINSTGFSQYNTIVGGQSNIANGGYCVVGGRTNTASSQYSTVLGGQSNTASTNTHATVVGGQSNTASGQHSIAGGNNNVSSNIGSVALGVQNTASGQWSFAANNGNTSNGQYTSAFGVANVASGQTAFVIGLINEANNTSSFASGTYSLAYLYSQQAIASGTFGGSVKGVAQQSSLTARREATLTTGATTVLSLDGTGTTNLIIPNGNNRSWNVTIKYVAVVTAIIGTATGVTVGDTKSQNIEIGFKRVGGTSSLVGAGSYSIAQEDASMNTATLVPTAGGSQELALTFTAPTFAGGGSVTCRVVAKVELVEVGF